MEIFDRRLLHSESQKQLQYRFETPHYQRRVKQRICITLLHASRGTMIIMGIDKLRLISTRFSRSEFIHEINEDQSLPRELRQYDVKVLGSQELRIRHDTICRIYTRRGIEPAFFLQLNFRAFPGGGIRHIIELNPNKLCQGCLDLLNLLEKIFGPDCADLKVSRIDPCADIELPVDFFRHSLRIPRKRKNTEFAEMEITRTYSNRGITGFYIGASPSIFRVYDKREEMKRLREDVGYLPQIITRLEWELRYRKVPISYISEIQELLEYRPFDKIEILTTDRIYDFHNDTKNSQKQFLLDSLTDTYGRQEAIRILNHKRNFKRDYGSIVMDSSAIKDKLNQSYRDGVTRFFNNEGADIRFRHEKTLGN